MVTVDAPWRNKPVRPDPADRDQLVQSPVKIGRVAKLFGGHGAILVAVAGIILLSTLVGLAAPFLLREIIDVALPARDAQLLIWLVGALVLVAAATGALGVWQTWLATVVGQRVMHSLRSEVFAHLQKQSMQFFRRTRGGEIQSRLLQDVGGLQSVVTTTATSIATNVTTVVATAAAMVALDWRLALLSALVLPPAVWGTWKVAVIRREVAAAKQSALADLHSQVEENLSVNGALLTKALGSAPADLERFTATSTELIALEVRSQLAGRWRMATMAVVFAGIPALLYLTAGYPQIFGNISIGTIIAFASLQTSVFRPIMGLLSIGAQWVASMALLSRIFGYLDLPIEVAEPPFDRRLNADLFANRAAIKFEAVTYRYPDGSHDVLQNINLNIPAGAAVAVVGESGSGKSTLASMVLRLADPTAGRILIGDVDLRAFTGAQRAQLVGIVSQETYLVHASIAENLRRAVPQATPQQLWEALEVAQLADLVSHLPDGLDTVVGARGHRFSGGERQRLAIARTILMNPPILILDEATSALDNETEREVQVALRQLLLGRTSLTIAHRLETVRHADQIVVLAAGKIVECGTHHQLLQAAGPYAHLHP